MKQWDKIFKEKGRVFIKPQEDLPKIVKIFKKEKVKRVLDLGCGSGRHLVYLAKNGFDVYGIDISKHGVKLAKEWLKQEGLKAKIKIGDIYKKLPYPDDFFDALISTQALHHNTLSKIKKLVKEIERILKPGGLIFITVRKAIKIKGWKKGKLAIHTYRVKGKLIKVPLKILGDHLYTYFEGGEKGLLHYCFTEKKIKEVFKNFKIFNIWTRKGHYCIFAKLKNEKNFRLYFN